MKDAAGHGSDRRLAAHQSGVSRIAQNADDATLVQLSKWQRETVGKVLAEHAAAQGGDVYKDRRLT